MLYSSFCHWSCLWAYDLFVFHFQKLFMIKWAIGRSFFTFLQYPSDEEPCSPQEKGIAEHVILWKKGSWNNINSTYGVTPHQLFIQVPLNCLELNCWEPLVLAFQRFSDILLMEEIWHHLASWMYKTLEKPVKKLIKYQPQLVQGFLNDQPRSSWKLMQILIHGGAVVALSLCGGCAAVSFEMKHPFMWLFVAVQYSTTTADAFHTEHCSNFLS